MTLFHRHRGFAATTLALAACCVLGCTGRQLDDDTANTDDVSDDEVHYAGQIHGPLDIDFE